MDCSICLCDFFCLISFTILTGSILFECCLCCNFYSWMYFKNLCSMTSHSLFHPFVHFTTIMVNCVQIISSAL
ncbi:hypothetical protein IMY05_013G0105300 [Salix suchowensis]|nr:hypothetical protein IMY05_013G0105300 [Salix suchowensis]